jgi:hypothetical protein
MEYTENNLFILITLIFAGFLVISFYVRYKFKSLHKDNFTNQASNGMNGCELFKFLTNKIKMNLEINIIQESFSEIMIQRIKQLTFLKMFVKATH